MTTDSYFYIYITNNGDLEYMVQSVVDRLGADTVFKKQWHKKVKMDDQASLISAIREAVNQDGLNKDSANRMIQAHNIDKKKIFKKKSKKKE